jgi:putative SOS response-associated peptidase YedK
MCGRYTLRTPLNVLAQQFLFELTALPPGFDLQPRSNISPTQMIPIVRRPAEQGPRLLALARWGLIPSWSKDAKSAAKLINARSETLAEKPSFRTAFKKRRCLILADGYYEWKTDGQRKIPHWFRRQDEEPFAFAGLWESWRVPPGDPLERLAIPGKDDGQPRLETATIITTAANELSAGIHDRMPVILPASAYDQWLNPAFQEPGPLTDMLRPFPADELKVEPLESVPKQ